MLFVNPRGTPRSVIGLRIGDERLDVVRRLVLAAVGHNPVEYNEKNDDRSGYEQLDHAETFPCFSHMFIVPFFLATRL